MGCCSSYEKIYDENISVAPGVTCEQAREFVKQGPTWKAINSPDGAIEKHDDGSWTLKLPNGDPFLVYAQEDTGTAEAGDLALFYRGKMNLGKIGELDFAQKFEFKEGGEGSGITIRRQLYDLKISGCISCCGCCCPMALPSGLKTEDAKLNNLLSSLSTPSSQVISREP